MWWVEVETRRRFSAVAGIYYPNFRDPYKQASGLVQPVYKSVRGNRLFILRGRGKLRLIFYLSVVRKAPGTFLSSLPL